MSETLAEIGEIELLNRLKIFMPKGQIDDDTAEINTGLKTLLINTDISVEGVHFNEITNYPRNIGWKAITSNISDLASSGVDDVLSITVGLVAPPSTTWEWVEEAYIGINDALNEFGGTLIGGDCSQGKQIILAITAIGSIGDLRLHRSNALPGDYIVSSGPHGLSRLGLALLINDPLLDKNSLTSDLKNKAILSHQRPIPPLEALRTLKASKPKESSWRAAGTDSSDGLFNALLNICKSSHCQALIDPKKLPTSDEWPSGKQWNEWCMHGGEDYELIVSLPSEWAKSWIEIFPKASVIGKMREGEAKILWSDESKIINNKEFEHFK